MDAMATPKDLNFRDLLNWLLVTDGAGLLRADDAQQFVALAHRLRVTPDAVEEKLQTRELDAKALIKDETTFIGYDNYVSNNLDRWPFLKALSYVSESLFAIDIERPGFQETICKHIGWHVACFQDYDDNLIFEMYEELAHAFTKQTR